MTRLIRWGWAPTIAAALVACGWADENELPERKTNTPSVPDPRPDPPPTRPDDGFCEHGSLDYGPVTLPRAVLGQPYQVRLAQYAEQGWSGAEYEPSSPPPGFEIEGRYSRSELVLRGVPTEVGKFTVSVRAIHSLTSEGCSIMPDPHTFDLEVLETAPSDAGTDADAEAPLPPPPR